MEIEKLKVGIAGYGVVGQRRRYYIDKHPSFRTVAICDVTLDDLIKEDEGVKSFNHYSGLLQEDLDVLFVCLPNYLASEVTIAGLNKGFHVFCEKPPGKSVSEIQNVITTENKHPGLKLKYGFNHRYHDSVIHALEIIRAGKLGSLINIRGVYGKSMVVPFDSGWRSQRKYSGGGILLDQGIHMVDLINQFTDKIIEVKSFVNNSYWRHDVEDNAYALLKDKNGSVIFLHSSATQWQHRFQMDITLTEGFIELHGILSGSKSYGEEKIVIGKRDNNKKNGQMETTTVKYLEDHSWEKEILEFADSIINDSLVLVGTSKEALESMELVSKIYEMDASWVKNK
jgi:predicted dehydrogenase